MPRLVWLTTLALALFAYGAWPASAEACSAPMPSIMVHDAPANGVVVLEFWCTIAPCALADLPDVLPVVDVLSGDTVPGEVLRKKGGGSMLRMLWLPDEPLVAGRSYEITWRPPAHFPFPQAMDYVFEALPEVDYDVTAPVVESQLDVQADATTVLSCESTYIDSCGTKTQTIPLDRRTRPVLSVYFDAGLDTFIANAFELRGAFWSGDEAPPVLGPAQGAGEGLGQTFDAAAEQYCYRVELRSLIDDSTAVHEACVPHGDLGAIETIDTTSEELARTLQNCLEPPSGYEAEWCSGTRERCAMAAANGWAAQGCADFERRCAEIEPQPQPEPPAKPGPDPGGPDRIPSPQPAGTGGGAAGSGGATPDTDEPIRFRRADDPDHPRTAKYGCSAGGPAAHGTWAALVLACVVLARRRRSAAG